MGLRLYIERVVAARLILGMLWCWRYSLDALLPAAGSIDLSGTEEKPIEKII